jgi:hypothetical protein
MEAPHMAIEARIRELGSRHQLLDKAIEEERKHPSADPLRVHELKRQKLRLKEEMEGLKARPN